MAEPDADPQLLIAYYRKRLQQIVERWNDTPDQMNPPHWLAYSMSHDAQDALRLGQFDLWMRDELAEKGQA